MEYHQPDFFGTGTTPVEHVTYPDRPGFKASADTGREAAEAMAPKMGRLQRMVHEMVKARGLRGMTPEEASEVAGIERVAIQPRFSELKAKGLLVDSGQRRLNPSSRKRAVVWIDAAMAPKPDRSGGDDPCTA